MNRKFMFVTLLSILMIGVFSCSEKPESAANTILPNQAVANKMDRIVVDKLITNELVFYVPESFAKKYSAVEIRVEKFYIAKSMGYTLEVDSEMETQLIAEYKLAGKWDGRTSTYPWEQDGPGMMCQNTTGCGCTAQMDAALRQYGSCCMCYVRGPQMNCQLYIASGTACASS